jgi:hypothetical protein
MTIYFANIKYKTQSNAFPYPTLKILKDHVREGLREYEEHFTGIADLSCIAYIKLCDNTTSKSIQNGEDVTKWFYESYYTTHANKKEREWLEKNIFKINSK